MCALSFECGMTTRSWYAEFALRRRVEHVCDRIGHRHGDCHLSRRGSRWRLRESMTVHGPVAGFEASRVDSYQLDLLTPGSSPRCAISRTQMRHSPNLRSTARGRPHFWQRV